MKITDLQPDKRNANKGTARGRKALAASLRKYGAGRAILADRNNTLIAGNKTWQEASALGLPVRLIETDGKELVVVKRTDLDLERDLAARELAIADNRVAELDLDWDSDAVRALVAEGADLAALFEGNELAGLISGVTEDPDVIPEVPQIPVSREGDLWTLGRHRLLCGNSTDAAARDRLLGGEGADCVFTSPPYAVGIDYGPTYEDTISNLRPLLATSAKAWAEVVVSGGFAVVNFGDLAAGRAVAGSATPCEYPMALEYWPAFRSAGWALWSRRAWCKPNARVHSPWCIQSNRAATDWEHVWTWKRDGDPIMARVDGPMPSSRGWFDTTSMDGVDVGKEVHGAGMALGAAAWMLSVHSRPGHRVFEPFCGTGTTLVAAEQTGRMCSATDVSPAYVDLTVLRWQAFSGKTATLEGDGRTFAEIRAERAKP